MEFRKMVTITLYAKQREWNAFATALYIQCIFMWDAAQDGTQKGSAKNLKLDCDKIRISKEAAGKIFPQSKFAKSFIKPLLK